MRKFLLASYVVFVPFVAHATFVVNDTADTKIFFNSAKDVTSFTGNVAPNNTGDLVNFTSQGAVDPKNGFANITPTNSTNGGNGDFVHLVINPTVLDWSAFTFRGQFGSNSPTDDLTLTVTNQFNASQTFSFNNLAGPNTDFGDIGITSIDGQRIKQLVIDAGVGDNFKELKQFEVARNGTVNCPDCVPNPQCTPETPCATSEPQSMLLLGMGLIGLGFCRKLWA